MKKTFLVMSLNNNFKYYLTRHNVASWWIRYFCFFNKFLLLKDSERYVNFGFFSFKNFILCFLEPFYYINMSGLILENFLLYYKFKVDSLLIVHDDLDLDVGDIRVKYSGSSSSHNGVISIVNFFKTEDFLRLRIGIGRSSSSREKYVLSEPNYIEKKKIIYAIKSSMFLIDDILNLNFSSFKIRFIEFLKKNGERYV